MNSLQSHKVVMVDCDDTLIMWQTSEYPELLLVDIPYGPYEPTVGINQKNVNLVKKLAKLGYTIICWSQSGFDWAQAVSRAVGLQEYVSLYLTKPRYYVDDLKSDAWIGERIWRHPITGESD